MTFNGSTPVALSQELRFGGNTVVFSMTNRDLIDVAGPHRIRRDTFLIRRILTLHEDAMFETVEIKNFDSIPHEIQIEQWAGGRFDDVFEVRGFPQGQTRTNAVDRRTDLRRPKDHYPPIRRSRLKDEKNLYS